MVDTLTQADFQRWSQPVADLPPQAVALLTGFPRSGTTLLEQLLDAHPQLVSSEERDYLAKELLPSVEAAHPPDTPIQAALDAIPTQQLSKARHDYLEVLRLPWDRSLLNYRQRVHAKLVESPTYEAVAKPVYQTSIGRP